MVLIWSLGLIYATDFEILSDSFETSLDNRHYSSEPEIKALNLMIKVTMAGFA